MGRAFEFRKVRKMKRWSKMAKTFTKIGKDIVIAVKEGGSDPETNARLRAVMQNAKTANMPKENVERAIKKATEKDTSDYKEILFEGYGPYGIAILIETATDNNNRTVASMRNYFTHNGGNMGTSGSVEFMFEKNCHFSIPKGELDVEELEFELIDHGAEDVFEEDENIMIYGSFENFGSLQKELENKGYEILSSGYDRIRNNTTKLTEEQEAEVEKLLEKFEDDEDVQSVYHSMG